MYFSGGFSYGVARGAFYPPRAPKFFRFHAVFGEIWQNRMLSPPGELAPPLGKFWIRRCFYLQNINRGQQIFAVTGSFCSMINGTCAHPHLSPTFAFNFMQFSLKNWPNNMLVPRPFVSWFPPLEHPGSATASLNVSTQFPYICSVISFFFICLKATTALN